MIEMFDFIGIVSIVFSTAQAIKDAFTPTIPAENWANKELYYKDVMNGVPVEQRLKNVENGKYKITNTYPEPHRDPVSGKIIIENNLLYQEDLRTYSASQVMKWVEQGRYNLTPEELKKEHERLKKKYEYLYSL
jgi:hypothetical protein